MSNSNPQDEPALVVEARPQIVVRLNPDGTIAISTASIDATFERVEFDTVLIPLDDAQMVIDAMQGIVDQNTLG